MNINFGINFDGILKFNKGFWVKVGSWAVNQIRSDAQQGIFQTDEPVKTTYSKQYAELKANRMQTQGKDVKGKSKPEKVKSLKGVSIVSSNTSFVDMTLTGQTLRGLKITEQLQTGCKYLLTFVTSGKLWGTKSPD